MKGIACMRQFHRLLGVAFVLFFLNSALTGLLWAYAPLLYWEDGYMRKKSSAPSPVPQKASLTISEAVEIAQRAVGPDLPVASVALRPDFGRLLYDVQYQRNGSTEAFLLDAITGESLSPLTEANAVKIARQYVRGRPEVESVFLLDDFVPRTGTKGIPAYRVRFRQPGSPEIFIHRDSGQILEDQDRSRRFHFLIMKLHQLNFFAFRKTLTIIPGLSLLAMIATGVVVWVSPRIRSSANRRRKG